MYRVMIRDNMAPVAGNILEETGKIRIETDNNKEMNDPKLLAEVIGQYDGIAVRSGTRINSELISKAGKLKVIGRAGVGVDNIDVGAATSGGIVVMNAPGGNTVTTAEHALSMMLSLARQIPQATASMRQGLWEKKKFKGVEIAGKTLGIIGLGQIGRVVASRAIGLDMKVVAFDPFVTMDAADSLGVELISLEELYSMADFVTLHAPRLEDTKNLICKESIAMMKKGVKIINCARGEIVNLEDLYNAVMEGHVSGAAIDVYPQEPPDFSLPMFKHPNIIFTPHLGASTGEAQIKVAEMIGRQMADFLLNGVITNAVNFPSMSTEMLGRARPFLQLAERMGSLMGQVMKKPHDITITYSGGVTNFDTHILTHALLKGLLGAFTDEPVNYINAPGIARDKGMNVEETVSLKMKDYTNLIQIKLHGNDEKLDEVWGTIFQKKYQRIVRLGRIYMDATPEGAMLIIQNHDKPGVIGNIGTLLADHHINIARFHLGRRSGKAICMVNIDSPIDEDTINKVRSLPNIITAQKIHLD